MIKPDRKLKSRLIVRIFGRVTSSRTTSVMLDLDKVSKNCFELTLRLENRFDEVKNPSW